MIYSAINDWIPQPGRITRSWSSGLVLLQQDFIGSLSDLGPIAIEGDPFPADDAGTGAKVYGIPEYRDLGNGLQGATVSAYGIVPGKAGVQTLTELSFSLGNIGFTAVETNPAANPPNDYREVYKNFPILITNKKFVKPFFEGSPSTISTPADDDEFKILAIGNIGSMAAGASLKGAAFTVSQIFSNIKLAWSGNHSPRPVNTMITNAFGSSMEFQNFGKVIESSATFQIMPILIDFGEFQVPQNP
jgi:hypothetical protein